MESIDYVFRILLAISRFGIIAYMIYCIVTSSNILCKITAAVILFGVTIQLILWFDVYPPGLFEILYLLGKANLVAFVIFAIQLFMTASLARQKGVEGSSYNYIIGASLLLITAFSIPSLNQFFDGEWFFNLYVRKWPDAAIVATFVVMRIKRISLDKSEDKLLWYFAVIAVVDALFLLF